MVRIAMQLSKIQKFFYYFESISIYFCCYHIVYNLYFAFIDYDALVI